MTTAMLGDVYDALLEAGASPEKARKAAEAVAGFDTRANRLGQDSVANAAESRGQAADLKQGITDRFAKVGQDIAGVRAELLLLKWMVGVVIAGILVLVLRAFFPIV